MKKILLVEDDLHLSKIITQSLTPQYDIYQSTSVAETFGLLESSSFDVILLDRLLTDGDAIDVIEYMASAHYQTKIIVISSLYKVAEKIRGLELGADDYLPKPFSLGELKLKVAKACCYSKQKSIDQFTFKGITFTPSSGEISVGLRTARLRKKESDILACLCKYKNQVVSRTLLLDEVWANSDVMPTQTTLDVYIRRIRMVLQAHKSLIVTKRGFGYMLTDTGN